MESVVVKADFRKLLRTRFSAASGVSEAEIINSTLLYEPIANSGLGFAAAADPVPAILEEVASDLLRKIWDNYQPRPPATPGGEFEFGDTVDFRFSWLDGIGVTAVLDVIRRALKADRVGIEDPLRFTSEVAHLTFVRDLEHEMNDRLLRSHRPFTPAEQIALLKAKTVGEVHDVLAKIVRGALKKERA